jgi:putative membrane protein
MSSVRRIKRSIATSGTVLGVAGGLAGLTLASPLGAAAASETGGDLTNRETVQAKLDSSGNLESARIYSQLAATADKANVQDPAPETGLRNLNGFGAPLVRDGKAQYGAVKAGAPKRTVAEYKGDLPVTLKAEYTLDGEKIDAEDLVGKTGDLEVTYTVVNRTAEPTEITYQDYEGNDITETADVVTPYVGSLDLVLPAEFAGITAEGADVGGDGRNGTKISWSLVLFDPVGSPAQQISWTAKIDGGELPPVEMTVVPVGPGGNSVLPRAQASYDQIGGGLTTLTGGAFRIDGKVLELRDGARKILDGVTQLNDGAQALNKGLADTAAPGAQKLSDGLGSARSGGQQLDSGLGQLLAGSGTLSDGLGSARSGGQQLDSGLAQLLAGSGTLADGLQSANSGGAQLAGGLRDLVGGGGRLIEGLDSAAAGGNRLSEGLRSTTGQADLTGGTAQIAAGLASVRDGVAQLAGTEGLPKAQAGLQQLLVGLDRPAGTQGPTDPGGLLQVMNTIAAGLTGVQGGLGQVLDPATGLPAAKAGVTASKEDLAPKVAPGGSLDQLVGGATAVEGGVNSSLDLTAGLCEYALPTMPDGHPAKADLTAGCGQLFGGAAPTQADRLRGGAAAVQDGVEEVRTSSKASYDGLVQLEAGLTNALNGLNTIKGAVDQLAAGQSAAAAGVETTLIPGVEQLLVGVGGAVTGLQTQLAPGVNQLADGSGTLAQKTSEAADGAAQLSGGLNQLAAGGGQLAEGAGKASAGATALSEGLGKLADGSVTLRNGLGSAKQGTGSLSEGLGKLADGSVTLRNGLGSAKEGTGKLVDGLGQLDDGGQALATGLGAAADGSGKLADGLGKVEEGQTTLADGANRLSGEGTKLLGGSANTSAKAAMRNAAILTAMAEKAESGALPYGLPEGSDGTAAFNVVLAGATSQSSHNATNGAAALALLALASGGALLARRRITG